MKRKSFTAPWGRCRRSGRRGADQRGHRVGPVAGGLTQVIALGELGEAEDLEDLLRADLLVLAEAEGAGLHDPADAGEHELLLVRVDRDGQVAAQLVGHALTVLGERAGADVLDGEQALHRGRQHGQAAERGGLHAVLLLQLGLDARELTLEGGDAGVVTGHWGLRGILD